MTFKVWLEPFHHPVDEEESFPNGAWVADMGADKIFQTEDLDAAFDYRDHMADLYPDAVYRVVQVDYVERSTPEG